MREMEEEEGEGEREGMRERWMGREGHKIVLLCHIPRPTQLP